MQVLGVDVPVSHGLVLAADLRVAGVPRRHVAEAVAAGLLVRVRRGSFILPQSPPSLRQAVAIGGRLGCVSAARLHGLWTLPFSRVHVWIPPTQSRLPEPGRRRVHRDRGWSGDDRAAVSLPHALLQIARCQGTESFLVTLESALNQRKVESKDLDILAGSVPPHARAALWFCRSDAQSGLETLVRWRLHQAGIDARPQVNIAGVGRVDLLIGRSLIIELDGQEFHEFEGDRSRDAAGAARGYVTLRFSYRQVMQEWPLVLVAVQRHMALGLHLLGA
jgi:very-short-patch-repair endonuclease